MKTTIAQRVRTDATILAALRYWAEEGLIHADEEILIASDGGTIVPLSAEETHDLADRINCGEYSPLVVVEINGGAIHSAMADSPVQLFILDEDIEGADQDRLAMVDGSQVSVTEKRLARPTAQDAQRLERISNDIDAWRESVSGANRTDIEFRQIGRDEWGVEGHDVYLLVWSKVDEVSEAQVQAWLYQRFFCGEPTANVAALTRVSVMPHTTSGKFIAVLHYARDV
jgi:hypothetical protein